MCVSLCVWHVQIYKKYGDKWIVDLLLNDLIDWHDVSATTLSPFSKLPHLTHG
jgi:hypothetical protein